MDLKFACQTRFGSNDSCHEWIDAIEAKLVTLNDKFDTFLIGQSRPKRAVLDFIGDIAGDLFGVLGSRFKGNTSVI